LELSFGRPRWTGQRLPDLGDEVIGDVVEITGLIAEWVGPGDQSSVTGPPLIWGVFGVSWSMLGQTRRVQIGSSDLTYSSSFGVVDWGWR
jgi:hypothetical protein